MKNKDAKTKEAEVPTASDVVTETTMDKLPVPLDPPDTSDDFSEHAGAGMENVGAADLLVPRLTILQQLSPQLNDRKAEFIEGAKQGMLCDVGVGEVWTAIHFVPCHYEKVWLEWAPRASGKGLVAVHNSPAILDKCRLNEKNQPMNGPNLVSETAQVYGINLSAGGRRSFISFASTQLKSARKWMMLATGEKLMSAKTGKEFTPPLFYRSYIIDSTMTSNAEGDWFLYRVARAEALPALAAPGGPFPTLNWKSLRDECVAFADSLRRGEMKADASTLADDPSAGSSSAQGDDARM